MKFMIEVYREGQTEAVWAAKHPRAYERAPTDRRRAARGRRLGPGEVNEVKHGAHPGWVDELHLVSTHRWLVCLEVVSGTTFTLPREGELHLSVLRRGGCAFSVAATSASVC
jgi:hypothetical protein